MPSPRGKGGRKRPVFVQVHWSKTVEGEGRVGPLPSLEKGGKGKEETDLLSFKKFCPTWRGWGGRGEKSRRSL